MPTAGNWQIKFWVRLGKSADQKIRDQRGSGDARPPVYQLRGKSLVPIGDQRSDLTFLTEWGRITSLIPPEVRESVSLRRAFRSLPYRGRRDPQRPQQSGRDRRGWAMTILRLADPWAVGPTTPTAVLV